MSIVHHPSDIILAEFANSLLDEAAAFVVGVHVSGCPACQQTVRRCEVLGGAMLQEAMPVPALQGDSNALLDRLDAEGVAPLREPLAEPVAPADMLSLYEGGDWRWIGPGIHWRKISAPSQQGIRVFMLKARGGATLPHHKHSGIEWTQVLQGAFNHSLGRFGQGDFDEADATVEHDPVVEKGSDCICLVAMNGRLELQGMLGKIVQPFVRL